MHVARVALPPNRRNADVGALCHGGFVGHTGGVEHGLDEIGVSEDRFKGRRSYPCTGEVMASRDV